MSMLAGLHVATSYREEGGSVLCAFQKLLPHSVTASLELQHTAQEQAPSSLRRLFKALLLVRWAVRTACVEFAAALSTSSSQLAERPWRKETVLVTDARGDTACYRRRDGGDCLFPKTPGSAANGWVPGPAISPILSGLHPSPGLAGGKKERKRKAEGWAFGPHPARPGAQAGQRPGGVVRSVRSPHPEASRGTAAFVETGFKSTNSSYRIHSRQGIWGTEALQQRECLTLGEPATHSAIRQPHLGEQTPPPNSGQLLHLETLSCGLRLPQSS